MAEKYFDRDEAEQLLPMIGESLGRALEQKKIIETLDEEFARASARIMALGGSVPPSRELARKKSERDQSASQLKEIVTQIQDTGCVIKDLDVGLVDFPSLRDGQEVYLCWKLGEDHIGYYHGVDEGFAGRKPLDDSLPEDEPPSGPSRVN
jgi:hypothetical protein